MIDVFKIYLESSDVREREAAAEAILENLQKLEKEDELLTAQLADAKAEGERMKAGLEKAIAFLREDDALNEGVYEGIIEELLYALSGEEGEG
jgi:hypothetical protein